jgi:hypothetical protein
VAERKVVDWEAVERDYRTGRLSLRELEAMHGPSASTIMRRARSKGWTQDLSDAIRQATNAAVIAERVQQECNAAQRSATGVVLEAAGLNARVLLRHQGHLERLRKDADMARDKLIKLSDVIVDINEAQKLVNALEASARTMKIIIDAERKVFRLDEDDDTGNKAAVTVNITRFSGA